MIACRSVAPCPSSRALSGGEHEFASDVASLADPLGVSGAFKRIRTSYRRGQVATRGQLCQPGQIARGPVLRRASTEGHTQLPGGRVRDSDDPVGSSPQHDGVGARTLTGHVKHRVDLPGRCTNLVDEALTVKHRDGTQRPNIVLLSSLAVPMTVAPRATAS